MNKICEQCKQSFTQKNNVRGSEQKYCSIKCRQISAQTRMVNKIRNEVKNENENEIKFQKPVTNDLESIYPNDRRENSRIDNRPGFIPDTHLSTIEKLYETKNEVIFYKLKCENLQKENAKLLIDVVNLESELEESEGEEKSDYENMLGGVMQQFKQDPITTINFASELIGSLFKTKKNETVTK